MSTPCAQNPQKWEDVRDGESTPRRRARLQEAMTTCRRECDQRAGCLQNRLADPFKPGGVFGRLYFPEKSTEPAELPSVGGAETQGRAA